MAYYGWDKHAWEVDPSALSASMKTAIIARILFILSSTSVRTALLISYLYLVRNLANKQYNRIIYTCLATNGALCFVACMVALFQCM